MMSLGVPIQRDQKWILTFFCHDSINFGLMMLNFVSKGVPLYYVY